MGLFWFAAGCGDERCLAFDFSPPPAAIAFQDAESGEALCDLTVSPRCDESEGSVDEPCRVVPVEDLCQYRFYGWAASAAPGGETSDSDTDLDSISVSLRIPRYVAEDYSEGDDKNVRVVFAVERGACDEIKPPEPQVIRLRADATYQD